MQFYSLQIDLIELTVKTRLPQVVCDFNAFVWIKKIEKKKKKKKKKNCW